MPDIMMCRDNSCGKKKNCFRYMADPSEFRQSYFVNSPRDQLTGHCDWFFAMSYDPLKLATETALLDGRV